MRRIPESITKTEIQQVADRATSDYDAAAEAEAEAEEAMNIANNTLDECERALNLNDPEVARRAKVAVCARWNECFGKL